MMQKYGIRHFPAGIALFPACRHTISVLLNSPHRGFFSPFPRGTCSLSVDREYSGLRMVPARCRQDCTVPPYLGSPLGQSPFRLRGSHPLWPAFSRRLALQRTGPMRSHTTPTGVLRRFGLSASLAHYSRNRFCFLFLEVLRCFTSPRIRFHCTYEFSAG